MKKFALVITLGFCVAAYAQLSTGFEPPTYNGDPAGIVLTGQDNWYQPVVGSAEYKVYTYAGNTYNVPDIGMGGKHFVAGRMEGNLAYARAQRNHNYGTCDVWTVTYDVLGKYTGVLPAVDNLGSFGLQSSITNAYWQSLFRWMDVNNPTAWKLGFLTTEHVHTDPLFPPEFQNLAVDKWYRVSTQFDVKARKLLEASIQQLPGGQVKTVIINETFLNPSSPTPTGFRFFTGGGPGTSPPGNFVAWDNFSLVPEPASLVLLALSALALRRR